MPSYDGQYGGYDAQNDGSDVPLMGTDHSTHGSVPNLKLEGERRSVDPVVVVMTVLVPWGLFVLIMFGVVVFTYNQDPLLLGALVALTVLIPLFFLIIGGLTMVHPQRRKPQPLMLAIGLLGLAAMGVGGAVGAVINAEYMLMYHELESGAAYRNVDPRESSAATSDGVLVEFVNRTFVDDRRTVGFRAQGRVWCVAPVTLPPLYTPRVEYWAVGTDCCERRGNFACGSSRESGPLAGLAQPPNPLYAQAVREAKAVYGLDAAPAEPQYLAFVSSVMEVKAVLLEEALLVGAVAALGYLVASALAGLVLSRAVDRS